MIVGDDLHLPVGRPVKVLLRSIDVLHDFYVPEFRAKMDLMPGLGHLFLVHPHADRDLRDPLRRLLRHRPPADARQRRGRDESDYQAWLQKQQTFARKLARGAPREAGDDGANAAGTARCVDVPRCTRWERTARPCHPAAEVEDVELYHPKSWVTKYVFCQDAKVIAIQYSLTAMAIGLVALVLSWLMRLQLGFPGTFSFIDATELLPVHHHARHDHGDLPADRAVPRRLRQLPDPADGRRAGHGVPLCEHAELLDLSARGAGAGGELLRARAGRPGAGWTLYPPQAILAGTPGQDWGIILMLVSLILFIIGFTMGGLNYVVTVLQGAHARA